MRFVQAGVMLLGAALYLALVLLTNVPPPPPEAQELVAQVIQWTFIGWNVALLLVTVLAVVDSVKKVRAGRTTQLATGTLVVKLAVIPFFLINFILLALLTLGGLVLTLHGIGIALLFVVAIASVLTYVAMISTSVYGWATIVQLRRERRIGKARTVVYTILLLVFVADIAVGILLFAHSGPARAFKRRVWLALVAALLETLAILAIPGYAFPQLGLAWLSHIFVGLGVVAIVITGLRLRALRRRSGSAAVVELKDPEEVHGS